MNDRQVVTAQLGRPPRSVVEVAVRCSLDLPVVIEVPPHLDDGTPFPTTYWLTCPLATRRIGRLEAAGGVKAAEQRIEADPDLAERHQAAADRYRRYREAKIEAGDRKHHPTGGVGGTRRGVKCLHAHYADHAAGNDNPVGEHTGAAIEPLDCSIGCVVAADGGAALNPEWREPGQ